MEELFTFGTALEAVKTGRDTLPYLYIEYPDGKRCPWLASQTDIMAEDWRIL
jgi:hypothetical protein